MRNWVRDHPQCPLCYTNRKGRTNRKGHWGYREPQVARKLSHWEICVMRRPQPPPNGQSGVLDRGKALEGLDALYGFLTDGTWDDGKPRKLGTATIFSQDGRWKLSLNDRDQFRFAILTGTTLEELLEGANRGIEADSLDWRCSDNSRSKRR